MRGQSIGSHLQVLTFNLVVRDYVGVRIERAFNLASNMPTATCLSIDPGTTGAVAGAGGTAHPNGRGNCRQDERAGPPKSVATGVRQVGQERAYLALLR